MADNFYPPEMLIRHAREIGLDDSQKQAIETRFQESRQKFTELQQNLQKQIAAMSQLLHAEHPDEQEALAQLDKVLDAERQIKRLQLSLFLDVRNQLTSEQQAKVKDLRQKFMASAGDGHLRAMDPIRSKMQQLQERIHSMQGQGQDVAQATQALQDCRRLAQEGKLGEATAVLDRALAAPTDRQEKQDK
jgi:Spy/CpxP family protein refolding chaperone